MAEYRMTKRLEHDADAILRGRCLAPRESKCECAQHTWWDMLERDADRKKTSRELLKFEHDEDLKLRGVCYDDVSDCQCAQHIWKALLVFDRDAKREHKEALNSLSDSHIELHGICKILEGCVCPQHMLKKWKAYEARKNSESNNRYFNCQEEPKLCNCEYHVEKRRYNQEYYEATTVAPQRGQQQESKYISPNHKKMQVNQKSRDHVYTKEELKEIDKSFEFEPRRTEEELYTSIAPKLSFEALTNRCCAICDCDHKRSEILYEPLEEGFIEVSTY
jgi:hypothetical protein